MVAEFWPGWFDHWGEQHHKMEVKKVAQRVANILKAGASINFYMFHGKQATIWYTSNPTPPNPIGGNFKTRRAVNFWHPKLCRKFFQTPSQLESNLDSQLYTVNSL